jgi:hypothetical protein
VWFSGDFGMANKRSIRSLLAAASLAWMALAGISTAQARDVNWSIGISSPGVVVGVDNGRGVRVLPPPVYYAPPPPRPVYYSAPAQPVYYYAQPARPVYYAPAPVYVTPAPAYVVRDRDGGRHHRMTAMTDGAMTGGIGMGTSATIRTGSAAKVAGWRG